MAPRGVKSEPWRACRDELVTYEYEYTFQVVYPYVCPETAKERNL